MFTSIFLIILLVVGLALFIAGFFAKNGDGPTDLPTRAILKSVGGVITVIVLFALLLCSVVTVGTKNLGVETFGGKPVGYLTNGYHLIAPWDDVTEITNAVQTDTYASDGGAGGKVQDGAVSSCINVRIARQGTACVNVSIRWQAKASAIDFLFRNYKDNGAITDNLVLRDLQTAMNQQFVSYDPLGIDGNGMSTNKVLSAANGGDSISSEVQSEVSRQIGQWIDVQSVNIPLLNFDNATQDKINQLQQQVAATRVAAQQELTNKAQARANSALAQSVSNSPGVLTDKCLNILKEAVDKGQQLPAGFSCFSGSSSQIAVGVK